MTSKLTISNGDPPLLPDHVFMVTSSDEEGQSFDDDPLEKLNDLEDDMEFLASRERLHEDNGAVIVAELNRLSLDERERILHDLHGVSDLIDETPELLTESLNEMSELLDSKSSGWGSIRKSNSYNYAETENPGYVKDRKLRLLFLRSEAFHARPAAEKMQAFMTQKEKLFGKHKLCKNITLDDLSESDIECLKNGHFQLLSERDRSGRAVIVIASDHIKFQTIENELRQMYYFHMALLEEVDTQINGIVVIAYGLPSQSPRSVWQVNSLMSALPYRTRGFHVAKPVWGPWLNWLCSILEKRSRMRIRSHPGTHSEVLYSLMTFGIPTSDFPVIEVDGKTGLRRNRHHEWIEARHCVEMLRAGKGLVHPTSPSSVATTPIVQSAVPTDQKLFLPTSKDVLFGRGRPFQEHPGNIRLSLIVESLQERYEQLSRNDKTVLAEDVVNKMKAQGTRFLRQQNGYWETVKESMAREKVSQGFRSIRSGKTNSRTQKARSRNNAVKTADEEGLGKRSRNN